MNGFFTYQDAIDAAADFLGGGIGTKDQRDAKRAIQAAYKDLPNSHNWSYYYKHGRIITQQVYNSGTLSYSAATNQVTLTGGTWPSWARYGYLYVGVVRWRIREVVSATIATLDPILNPGADVAAGTSFALYQDTYLLPQDYRSSDQALYELNFGGMQYVHPREWLYENRYIFSDGVPQAYTIRGDESNPGAMFMSVFPFPTTARTIDFIYQRWPRPIGSAQLVNAGTVTINAGSNVVTGSGTNFLLNMPGAVIRFSSNTTAPTNYNGTNPPIFETTVDTYTSATSITVTDVAPQTLTGVAYTLSDAVDIQPGKMLNAFQRAVERELGRMRNLENRQYLDAVYMDALKEAQNADSPNFMGRSEGDHWRFRQRLRDMPRGPDMGS